ncbi:MAG TPA: hypothetical protein VFQ76_08710, partial [Longimicrobiaceae bacterium]|nr:hypothetical protein [Longimicrobiaceae bacterium]
SKQRPLKDTWLWILDYLQTEAQGGYGWRRRGVRGWRLYEEVEEALDTKIPELLPALWRAGLVDRTLVEDPSRSAPVYLYRISAAGNARLAREQGEEPAPFMSPVPEEDDPEEGTTLVPAVEWEALSLLRRQAREQLGLVRWEQHGWMTAREITRTLDRAAGDILPGLHARRLVERRRSSDGPGGKRALWYYRVSEQGLRAELVDAVPVLYEPPARLQVRVRPRRSGKPW